MKKEYLQCGYEDKCKNKDCLKCPRKKWKKLNLSLAEEIVIEDFAVCDVESMMKEKPEVFELMQNIMMKLMRKVFKEDSPSTKEKEIK